MGDEEDGFALGLPDAKQFVAHDHAGDGVERAERLVEEHHVGIDGERAGDLDTLFHAAGEFMRVGLLKTFQSDHLDIVSDPLRAIGPRKSGETEADVAFDGEPGEDTALLKDEDAARIGTADDLAVDADFAFSGLEKTSDGAEESGFATARGTKKADEFAVADLDVDVLEHGHALPITTEDHADVVGSELGLNTRIGCFIQDHWIRGHQSLSTYPQRSALACSRERTPVSSRRPTTPMMTMPARTRS